MLKAKDETKSRFSRSAGNFFLTVNDTVACNRLKNVYIKREHQAGVISPANRYHHEEANKQ
jgi:hypothetical protein